MHPSPDGADVATPVSVMEWFLNFYGAAREHEVGHCDRWPLRACLQLIKMQIQCISSKVGLCMLRACKLKLNERCPLNVPTCTQTPPLECVVQAGEVIFVPRGWWHACLNLETMTIAGEHVCASLHFQTDQKLSSHNDAHKCDKEDALMIISLSCSLDRPAVTQNYVSSANVADVMRFIQPGRSDLISGCSMEEREHLHGRFLGALKQQRPDIVQTLEQQEEARRIRREQVILCGAL